ncbi:Peroxisomal membrane protein PMP22 [Coccomyxa sp. Obi]|nr:Peroxisomal membrane protein PMP22 [Coccomyxa sp. Obi]
MSPVPSARDSRDLRGRPSVLTVAWDRYLRRLEKNPLQTKALTSSVIAGFSDVVAQRMIWKGPLNWRRTAALAVFGLVWSGPANHYWQAFLERVFRGKRDAATLCKKVLLDQLTYGPFNNILFMSYIALIVEGRSWEFTQAKLFRDFAGIQKNGWRLWPLASLINYAYVPLRLRVLFVNVVAFFWSTFMILRSRTSMPLLRR